MGAETLSCLRMWTLAACNHGNSSHHYLLLRVTRPWSYCSPLVFATVFVWEHILVCVRAQLWRLEWGCLDCLSLPMSHCCLQALCMWSWLDLLEAFVHSLLLSLIVSLPLSPGFVLCAPCMIFPHHSRAYPGMCLKAWATSGHSLSTGATCLMTQRTSAWSGRRRASPRFSSKVKYESLSLEESFVQHRAFFFAQFLVNTVIWA